MSDYKPVLTKKDFVRRYHRPGGKHSEFGNASFTWDTLEEYLSSGYEGLVHVRNRIAGGPTYYNMTRIGVQATFKYVPYDVTNWYISAMAPTESTTFQGEVMRGLYGLELTYTTIPLPMRDALRQETKYAQGIIALSLLQHYLDPIDYDWLMTLLDRYNDPPHVVEFSVYDHCWGTLDRRMVVWETRLY